MPPIEIILPLVLMGFFLYATILHVNRGTLLDDRKSAYHLLFGVLCVLITLYIPWSLIVRAADIAEAIAFGQKWRVAFTLLLGIGISWFASFYTDERPLPFLIVLSAVGVLLIALNALLPFGIMFSAITPATQEGASHTYTLHPWGMPLRFIFIFLYQGYVWYAGIRQYKRGERASARLILIGIASLTVAALVTLVGVSGLMPITFTAKYAYLAFALIMMYALSREYNEAYLAVRASSLRLAESEKRLAVLFDYAPDAMYITDENANILQVNKAACRATGYTEKELLRMKAMDVDARNTTLEDLAAYWRALEEGKVDKAATTHRRKDGSTYPVEVAVSLLETPQGRRVVTIVRNVSEKRKIEEELQASEARFRSIFENVNAAIALHEIVMDENNTPVDFIFLDANPAYAELTRLNVSDIIGKRGSEVIPNLEKRWIDIYGAVALTRKAVTIVDHSDYLNKYWEVKAFSPKEKQFAVVLMDITEQRRIEDILREREERLRSVFNGIQDAVFLQPLDKDGFSPFIEVNNSACERYGYTREEFLRMTVGNLVPKEHVPSPWLMKLRETIVEQGHFVFETMHATKDGSVIPVEINSALITLGDKKMILSVARDISVRKAKEEALHETQTRFRELFENMTSGCAVYTAVDEGEDFVFTNFNSASEQFENVKREDVIGKRVTEVFPGVKEMGLLDVFKRVWKTGEPEYLPVTFYKGETVAGWRDNTVFKLPGGEIVAIYNELTKQKRVELSLHETQTRFRELFENMTSGCAVYTAVDEGEDFVFTNFNSAGEQFENVKREDVIGKRVTEVFPGITAMGLFDVFKRVWKTGEAEYFPVSQYTDDRLTGWRDNTVFKLPGGEIVAIYDDRTEQKLAQVALQESEQRKELALRGADLGSWDWNVVTGAVQFDERWADMLGYTLDELEPNVATWKRVLHPDDRDEVIRTQQAHLDGRTEYYETIHRLKHKDGSWIWVIDKGQVIDRDADGNPLRACGTHLDITETMRTEERLKATEGKLNALFSAMTEMVVLHELVYDETGTPVDYRITDCNNAFSLVTGIVKEAVIGKPASEVYGTNPPPYFDEYVNVALSGETHTFTTYYEPMDKHLMISVVCPAKGEFATVTADITTLKQIQEIMAAKNKELENYLYVASHDLRSPLVNIQGFSRRLEQYLTRIEDVVVKNAGEGEEGKVLLKTVNEDIPKTFGFIFAGVSKMDTLINGLLQISRTGRVAMNIRECDIHAIIDKVLTTVSYQIQECGAEVRVEELPPCYGDNDLLNQLFSNIISNAIKYRSDARKLEIAISAETQYNRVVYRIADNGIGIASRHLERIWDVFFQVDPKVSATGDGIGLSIVKRIVDKHRGKVWLESEEGKGTTFFLRLRTKPFDE